MLCSGNKNEFRRYLMLEAKDLEAIRQIMKEEIK